MVRKPVDMDDFFSSRCVRVNSPIIVGAGPTGLAVGSSLKEKGVPCVILERADRITSLWQQRTYDRLKLHLPNMPFPAHYPEYPTLIGDFCGPVLSHVSEYKIGVTTYRGKEVPQWLQETDFFKKDGFPNDNWPKGKSGRSVCSWFHKERSSCRHRPPLRLNQPYKMVVTQKKKGDKKAK